MARKKSAEADPPPPESVAATGPQDSPSVATSPMCPSDPPPSDGNGNGEGRKPVKVLSYLVSRDTYVQASIWERVVTLTDGTTFTTHDVSVRKRYRDAQSGEWKSLHSFRGSELYALLHALSQAGAWILEARAAANNCPF